MVGHARARERENASVSKLLASQWKKKLLGQRQCEPDSYCGINANWLIRRWTWIAASSWRLFTILPRFFFSPNWKPSDFQTFHCQFIYFIFFKDPQTVGATVAVCSWSINRQTQEEACCVVSALSAIYSHYAAKGPNICLVAVAPFLKNFRCDVVRSATNRPVDEQDMKHITMTVKNPWHAAINVPQTSSSWSRAPAALLF